MAHPKYILKSSADERFYFSLTAKNGQVILTSQMYTSKANAVNGIVSVQINSVRDERFIRYRSADDQHYFNLKANNGQIIGTSEMYTSAQSMENGIESVKLNGHTVEIEDRSLIDV
ncbi:MAG: YegP family protein [Cyclobacteriaceae bacterium]